MATANHENAPAQRGGAGEGTETHLTGDLRTTVRPTARDITELLRSRPRDGDPAEVRDRWLARKVALVAAIEAATR